MALIQTGTKVITLTLLLSWVKSGPVNTISLKRIANVSYAAENSNPSELASIFSPRMDFDQWKPLTGRGDPLRNDPTYDYEPPVLERVHYWADETRLEREHYPDRKSEVLMLGVSSRKPSAASRAPLPPPRRHQRPKYEDFSYKLSDHYPMTILVPPPPPPPGHKPSLFVLQDNKLPPTNSNIKLTDPPNLMKHTTDTPEHLTSLYALQEANLIYQSSTTSQSWINEINQTKTLPGYAVSSDYAGWGPTTPLYEEDGTNDTHNLISIEPTKISKQPYSFYKPIFSEAPPPPEVTNNPILLPTFVPTALPPLPSETVQTTSNFKQVTWPSESPETPETTTYYQNYNEETTSERNITNSVMSTPNLMTKPENNIFDMLSPMFTMPLLNEPDRQEDHLYAHASENLHIFKEHQTEDLTKLETMQTMHPPPVESTTHKQSFHSNKHAPNDQLHKQSSLRTHDPYLHMRFTTPMMSSDSIDSSDNAKSTTETPTVPMYLIIQGHSKVKTYSSKTKVLNDNDTINNEIPKSNETGQVKHLHPLKDKYVGKSEKGEIKRIGRSQNLKSLVDEGHGSIEIQETNVGIKYDVSDGSEVPVEIYRKGIVDNDENNYLPLKHEKRTRRQIDLEDILPLDEDTLEEYVYNFLKGRRNETGITGLIAQAVTSNAAAVIDDLEDDDDDDDDGNDVHNSEKR